MLRVMLDTLQHKKGAKTGFLCDQKKSLLRIKIIDATEAQLKAAIDRTLGHSNGDDATQIPMSRRSQCKHGVSWTRRSRLAVYTTLDGEKKNGHGSSTRYIPELRSIK